MMLMMMLVMMLKEEEEEEKSNNPNLKGGEQFHEPFFQFACTGVVEAHFSIKSTGERSEP